MNIANEPFTDSDMEILYQKEPFPKANGKLLQCEAPQLQVGL